MRTMEVGRCREGTLDGRTPGVYRDLVAGQGRQRGGGLYEGRQSQDHTRNSLGRPEWEVIINKRWRPAGTGAVQVYGRYAPGKDGGCRSR